jgi:hypothetical protein
MKRSIVILLVFVLGAGLVACATHGHLWLGGDSPAPTSHDLGCGVPLMTTALVAGLLSLLLTGSLAIPRGPEHLLRLPVSLFQPPERSA